MEITENIRTTGMGPAVLGVMIVDSFSRGLLNECPRDSLCGVKGVLDYDSGVCCLTGFSLMHCAA